MGAKDGIKTFQKNFLRVIGVRDTNSSGWKVVKEIAKTLTILFNSKFPKVSRDGGAGRNLLEVLKASFC